MKRCLIGAAFLFVSTAAFADHLGVYSNASGTSVCLPVGFTSSVAVIHKQSSGAAGSTFALQLPDGSSFFQFNTSFTTTGSIPGVVSVNYGACLESPIVVGTVVAILAPGYFHIVAAPGYDSPMVVDCASQLHAATGGTGYAASGDCGVPLATESATWSAVKALYR
ncbi:MAG TPA: hypothetical protein VFH88_02705 [Candidatus Krumholzibacteria bacterium]|nr:hypothetical protein [Candidatus Krumholzibacteria bacterium]